MKLPWLNTTSPNFPTTEQALAEPNGLLAAGGKLSIEWLLSAYSQGIFPWFNEGDPILWWSPSPRMVLYPQQFHISRSLRKTLKRGGFRVTINQDFPAVIAACALPRSQHSSQQQQEPGTWITSPMFEAYTALHRAGWAHSIEVWHGDKLIGGLYGVALGHIFFGESMFSNDTNGSKIAVAHLAEWLQHWHYQLIDCQVYNNHLSSLGAIEIDRVVFERIIQEHAQEKMADRNQIHTWKTQDITLPSLYWGSSDPNKTAYSSDR